MQIFTRLSPNPDYFVISHYFPFVSPPLRRALYCTTVHPPVPDAAKLTGRATWIIRCDPEGAESGVILFSLCDSVTLTTLVSGSSSPASPIPAASDGGPDLYDTGGRKPKRIGQAPRVWDRTSICNSLFVPSFALCLPSSEGSRKKTSFAVLEQLRFCTCGTYGSRSRQKFNSVNDHSRSCLSAMMFRN